jgi:hypothetical protein
MLKPSIGWAISVLITLAGCGGVAPQDSAQDDMLSNPRGEFVSTDAATPDDFLIPGTDQPLAQWVQNRQNVRLGLANRP